MNKIIVYEHEEFRGLSKEFTSDVPDLRSVDFGDCISSIKVIGQPWVAFRDPSYKGPPAVFEEGSHKHIALNNHISSLQLVHEDLENPQITLYEHPNYQGVSKVVTEETNLTYGYFNDKASSHIVQKGAWLLYENPNRGGWFCVARQGAKLANYGPVFHFHDKLSHVYPLKGGRPIITTKIIWDAKKVESVREVMIDEIHAMNTTELDQTLTSSNSRVYETATSHSFRLTVPGLKINGDFKLDIDPMTTLTVDKGNSASATIVDKVEVTVPAKIPKYSEMTIQVIMKQITATVPVELTIMQNGKSKTEHGEYRTVSGRNITTKYTVKPIAKEMLLQ